MTVSMKFEVSARDETLDAYTLALECWDAWETYLP
jgi:hypothetical protein